MRPFTRLLLSLASIVLPAGLCVAAPFAYITNIGTDDVSVIDTATDTVTATVTLRGNPWGVVVNPSATRLYVTNRAPTNTLAVIDLATSRLVAMVPVGIDPLGVAINATGTRLYVTNYGSNNVSVIDTAADAVIGTVAAGPGCAGVALNPAGTRLYVTNTKSNDVSVIDTVTNTVVATVPTGSNPAYVAVHPDGTRVYVTNLASGSVSVIDTANNVVVASVPVGQSPRGVAANSAGTRIYVANTVSSTVSVIDTATDTVVATVATPAGAGYLPGLVAVDPVGTRVYVSDGDGYMTVIDASTNAVAATIYAGTDLAGIAVSPAGNRLYLADRYQAAVVVFDTATYARTGWIRTGRELSGPVAVNPAGTRVYVGSPYAYGDGGITVIDAASNTIAAIVGMDSTPRAIAVSPDGRRVYIANDSDHVPILDTATNAIVATVPVGASPTYTGGIALDSTGTRAFVTSLYPARKLLVIDTATNIVIDAIPLGPIPVNVVVSPDGTRAYVATGSLEGAVLVVDIATHTVLAEVPVGIDPWGMAMNPAGTRLYVTAGKLAVIDTVTNALIASVAPAKGTNVGVAVNPAGTRVYVASDYADSVSAIDTATNTVVATIRVGDRPVAMGNFIGPEVIKSSAPNYQGLWWNAPAGSESGWGINFAHQGDIIFATWFTYGADNQAQWYTVRAQKTANHVYVGPVSSFTGLPFDTVPYPANANVRTEVGTATITFTAYGRSAIFTYTVNGITQTKSIVPQEFASPVPTCVWGAQSDLTQATNYQDLWWVANGEESGWGINFAHQGKYIFATWFTYDASGKAWWLFTVAAQTPVPNVYSGLVKTALGPSFNAEPFDPNAVVRTTVGDATITVTDGNHARFDSTVNGITQTKSLTRQVFAPPGTVCQ